MIEGLDLISVDLIKNEEKGILYRFMITEFRDKHYIGIREWYLDYEGEYKPTKNGFTMPYTLESVSALFAALTRLLAKAEVLEQVQRAFDETITKES